MKRSTKRKLIRNGTYAVTHANPGRPARSARRGGARRNPRRTWKVTFHPAVGQVARLKQIVERWEGKLNVSTGVATFAAADDAEHATEQAANWGIAGGARQNPVVRRHKTVGEMRRAGVPDILPGTSTLIYESGRTAPLTGHSGHFLSASTHSTALMRRRQVGDEGEFSVVGRHNDWGERVRANPARYAVVHFRSPSDVTGKTISRHATLAAAQAAHAKIVLRNGKLISDYQSYGIIDV